MRHNQLNRYSCERYTFCGTIISSIVVERLDGSNRDYGILEKPQYLKHGTQADCIRKAKDIYYVSTAVEKMVRPWYIQLFNDRAEP